MKRTLMIFSALGLTIWFIVNAYLTWNNLGSKFFVALFDDDNSNVELICSDDNLADFNTGNRAESLHLSDDTFNKFKARFRKMDSVDIPRYKEHLYHNDNTLRWRITPIRSLDTLIINLKHRPFLNSTCLNIEHLEKILQAKDNYYAAYYDKDDVGKNRHVYDGKYYWFILESKTRTLYLISVQV